VSIEVLALLSNNLANNRCSWRSRSHDVIETVGGKVVGLMQEVFYSSNQACRGLLSVFPL